MHDHLSVQGLCLGLLMLSAHFCGRLALKLRIGQMIGQLLGGVLVGPYLLRKVGLLQVLHIEGYGEAFESFHFLIFTFLGVIAFALGEELHWDRLKKIGWQAGLISLFQGGVTWILLTGFFLLSGMQWSLALVIGSIGVATAPAITFALLNQFEIEGRFRNMVANILVLDDVLEVILFSIFAQIAVKVLHGGNVDVASIGLHLIREFGLAFLIGGLVFLILRTAVRSRPRDDRHIHAATLGAGFVSRLLSAHPTPSVEVLVVVIGTVAAGSAVGLGLHLPFLMIGITAGVLIANLHTHALFDSLKIDNIMPLLNLVFFALIGANINFDVFHGGDMLWMVGGYVLMRGIGKIAGTWLGARMTGQDPKIVYCLPFLMLPQAGVAAVEAVYVVKLLGDGGRIVADIVLPALVVFEIAGVFFSERALLKWRQLTMGEREVLSKRTKALKAGTADTGGAAALSQYIPDGLFGIPLASGTYENAVLELARLLEERQTGDAVTITERVMARERMAPTAVGCGVGLPHCKIFGLDRPVCAAGILPAHNGIAPGPDGVSIEFIFLLVSPQEKPDEHLRALAAIARTVGEGEEGERVRDDLRKRRDAWLNA